MPQYCSSWLKNSKHSILGANGCLKFINIIRYTRMFVAYLARATT